MSKLFILSTLLGAALAQDRSSSGSLGQYTYTSDGGAMSWTVMEKNYEDTFLVFDDPLDPSNPKKFKYPGRGGEAGAFPVEGRHAFTEFCHEDLLASGVWPNLLDNTFPLGSEDTKNVQAGDAWDTVPRTGRTGQCPTKDLPMNPRTLSNTLHNMLQQGSDHFNHVTAQSLQASAHDVGSSDPAAMTVGAFPPLLKLRDANNRDVWFMGGTAVTKLQDLSMEETRQFLANAMTNREKSRYDVAVSSHDVDMAFFNSGGSGGKDYLDSAGKYSDRDGSVERAATEVVKGFVHAGQASASISSLIDCDLVGTFDISSGSETLQVFDLSSTASADFKFCFEDPSKTNPIRKTTTQQSPGLDASITYGSDLKTAEYLREKCMQGASCPTGLGARLLVSKSAKGKDLLPTIRRVGEVHGQDAIDHFNAITDTFHGRAGCGTENSEYPTDISCYVAGDRRAMENKYLTAMHLSLVRKHNQIVNRLSTLPQWQGASQEHLYHEARVRVMAWEQHAYTLGTMFASKLKPRHRGLKNNALGQEMGVTGTRTGADKGISAFLIFEPDFKEGFDWENPDLSLVVDKTCVPGRIKCNVTAADYFTMFDDGCAEGKCWEGKTCFPPTGNLNQRWHIAMYDKVPQEPLGNDQWNMREADPYQPNRFGNGPNPVGGVQCEISMGRGDPDNNMVKSTHEQMVLPGADTGGILPTEPDDTMVNLLFANTNIANELFNDGLGKFIRQAYAQKANGNNGFPPSMRNMLFSRPDSPQTFFLDLASINSIRYRDRGVGDICDLLQFHRTIDQRTDPSLPDIVRSEVTWADLHLNPELEPLFRATYCTPCDAEAFNVMISQKADFFNQRQRAQPTHGIFPGFNDGNGVGAGSMGKYLTNQRAYFGFMENYWVKARASQPRYKEAIDFYKQEQPNGQSSLLDEFKRSVGVLLFNITDVEEIQCMPHNPWFHPRHKCAELVERPQPIGTPGTDKEGFKRCSAANTNFRAKTSDAEEAGVDAVCNNKKEEFQNGLDHNLKDGDEGQLTPCCGN